MSQDERIAQWSARHGLGPRTAMDAAECLLTTGWLRAIEGIDLDVSLWTRIDGFDRSLNT